MTSEFRDDWETNAPIAPPGKTIAEEIEARGWSQGELARRMGVSRQTVTDLVHARRRLSEALAEGLYQATGVDSSFWLNKQARYDRYLERERIRTA